MMHLSRKKFMSDEVVRETLYENHIAKTLLEAGYSLYYYQSGGKAEVNFVVQNRMGKIIPIEITTRAMSKAKSLSVLMKTPLLQRINGIRYLPVYSIFCLNDSKM